MFCEECGSKNESGTKFCTNCGHQITNANSVEKSSKLDLKKVTTMVTEKGKTVISKGKDYYSKKPNVVYALIAGIVLVIILFVILGDSTMKCEAENGYTTSEVEVKYSGDDITKIIDKNIIDLDDSDFKDSMEYLDMDIDEYIETIEETIEEELDDAPDGFDVDIKKSGDELIMSATYKGEALEKYLDDKDVNDIDDLEEYLEEDYTDYKCEK